MSYLAERLRRLALGLTAALITARAFFPSEPNLREGAADGLVWVLLLLVTVGIALAVPLLGGRLRFRWSAVDGFVVATMAFVALSATHSLDRRPAINLAWEWAALGFVYLLLRNLPRTRGESSVLAGALVATAVAVSAYGLYQNRVELPLLQSQYKRNHTEMEMKLNIMPGTRRADAEEPDSGLDRAVVDLCAGELAGGLYRRAIPDPACRRALQPGAGGCAGIARDGAGDGASARAGGPVLPAPGQEPKRWVGVGAGLCLLAVRGRRLASPRMLVATGLAGAVVVTGLVVAGLAMRRLDSLVLTETTKSMRTRLEYWQGAWRVIGNGAPSLAGALAEPTFWLGVGPGNFPGPYARHKLPEASEEIVDPHNLFLEVWATGGFLALVLLVAALVWGFWNLLGPPLPVDDRADLDQRRRSRGRRRERGVDPAGPGPGVEDDAGDAPPKGATWLWICSGAGWVLVVVFGWLNPFQADLFSRWLVLAQAGWPQPSWSRHSGSGCRSPRLRSAPERWRW